MSDTIVALSSPPGASERAVVRLSGPRTRELVARVFTSRDAWRRAALRSWRLTPGALRLPEWSPLPADVLFCRGPRSYTGEDLAELWVPGSPALVRRLLLVLQAAGARLADRGEFTRRAFHAGRLDLVEVEAVLALTTSADREQSRAALRSLAGGARDGIDAVKVELTDLRAHLEAAIDFSEEELDLATESTLATRLRRVAERLSAWRSEAAGVLPASTTPVVVLRGPANAGKSTLFNRLCGGRALVDNQAGTTRDVLQGRWELGDAGSGLVVDLLDTAGEAPAGSELEARALEAARARAAEADLVVWVTSADQRAAHPAPSEALWVLSKADLGDEVTSDAHASGSDGGPLPGALLRVSGQSGEGLARLAEAVSARLSRSGSGGALLGSARQDGLLAASLTALRRAADVLESGDPARAELAALDLADAHHGLGELTGAVTTEDLLGRIFGAFCIGK